MAREFRYQVGDDVRTVTVKPKDGGYEVRVGDTVLHLGARLAPNGRLDLEVDGRRLTRLRRPQWAAPLRQPCRRRLDAPAARPAPRPPG